MNARKEIPSGYTYRACGVLIPVGLAYSLDMDDPPPAGTHGASSNQDAETSPTTKPTRRLRRKSLSRHVLQVYSEDDVQEMEQSLQSLSRNNDRRKNYEALISLLRKKSPVGVRKLSKVPRAFSELLDQLVEEMPNFKQVVDTIRAMLALQVAGDGSFQLPPILLAGDPGVGKTYFAMRLAKLMGTGFDMISLEGANSPMSLIGLEQHYYTSSPGKVFDLLVQGHTANPVFVVDELDKASSEARFPPANALYQLLEPETAKRFCDQSCLHVKLDARRISWIVTANYLSAIPVPILSRLTTFHVPTPTGAERVRIASAIYRDLRAQMAWGRRFEPVLPLPTAKALAGAAGSVRPMKTLLRLACASAFLRKSGVVNPSDIAQALRCSTPLPDLSQWEVGGHA